MTFFFAVAWTGLPRCGYCSLRWMLLLLITFSIIDTSFESTCDTTNTKTSCLIDDGMIPEIPVYTRSLELTLKNVKFFYFDHFKLRPEYTQMLGELTIRAPGAKLKFVRNFVNAFDTASLKSLKIKECDEIDFSTPLFDSENPGPKFEQLEITNCNLESFDQIGLFAQTGLKTLNISANRLVELQNELDGLERLEVIDFSRNAITWFPRETFMGKTVLRLLNLNRNRLTSLGKDMFSGMRATILDLSYNRLMRFEETTFRDCSITTLRLDSNRLNSTMFNWREVLRPLAASLRHISIAENSKELLFDANAFQYLTALQNVSLAYSRIIRNNFIANLDCELLNISGNNILYLEPVTRPKRTKLIDISGNKLEELPVSFFHQYPTLETLIAANNSIKSIENEAFKKSQRLSVVDLRFNRIQAVLSSVWAANRLQAIRSFDLRGNAMHCNCRAAWLSKLGGAIKAVCRSPPSLAKRSISSIDAETFECSAPYIVNEEPGFISGYRDTTGVLECQVFGDPVPYVMWMSPNGQTVIDKEMTSDLSVTNYTSKHKISFSHTTNIGEWSCSFKGSNATRSVRVSYRAMPRLWPSVMDVVLTITVICVIAVVLLGITLWACTSNRCCSSAPKPVVKTTASATTTPRLHINQYQSVSQYDSSRYPPSCSASPSTGLAPKVTLSSSSDDDEIML